ncbi:MAG: hypothetical protein WDW38_004417 [Sanguina aurantia]
MLQLEERCQQLQAGHTCAVHAAHAHKTFSSRAHVDPRVLQHVTAELAKLLAHTPSLAQRQARWTRGDQLLSRLEAAVHQQLRCSDQLRSIGYNIHTDQINPTAISCEDFTKSAEQGADLALLLSACRLAKLLTTPSDLSVCWQERARRACASSMQAASKALTAGQHVEHVDLVQQCPQNCFLLALSGDFAPLYLGNPLSLTDHDNKSEEERLYIGLGQDSNSTASLLYLQLMLHTSSSFFVHCTGSAHITGITADDTEAEMLVEASYSASSMGAQMMEDLPQGAGPLQRPHPCLASLTLWLELMLAGGWRRGWPLSVQVIERNLPGLVWTLARASCWLLVAQMICSRFRGLML